MCDCHYLNHCFFVKTDFTFQSEQLITYFPQQEQWLHLLLLLLAFPLINQMSSAAREGPRSCTDLRSRQLTKVKTFLFSFHFFHGKTNERCWEEENCKKSYMKFIFSFSLTFLSSILFLDVPHVLKTCPVWRWGSSERKPNIVCYSLENGWSVSQTEKEGCNRGRLLLTLPGEPICKCKDIHKSGIWKSGTVCNWII